MKAFKKLALVTAIAAAPFAQAELTSIDDAALGEMTGQAGVTIELDTSIEIASIAWTDTDGAGASAGTLDISGIKFGGGTVGGSLSSQHDARLDDFKIDIDVDSADGLVIHLGGTDSSASMLGLNPVDFGLHIDSVGVSGLTSSIASDINIAGNLGPIDVKINNTSGSDLIDVQAYFEVTSGNLDVPVIGLGITNLTIGQDSQPLLSTGSAYQQEIRNALAAATGNAALATADAATLAATIDGLAAPSVYNATYAGTLAGLADASASASADASATTTADTNGTAGIQADEQAAYDSAYATDYAADYLVAEADAGNVATADGAGLAASATTAADANPQNATNMAFVALNVGSGSANYTSLTEGDVVVDNALIVNITDFNVDIGMEITMGSTGGTARSIGTIAIDDLNLAPGGVATTLKIYGH